jgi:hypothetical protein
MEENVSRGIETVVTHDLVQLVERHLELDSGQMGAEAAMDADAEGEAPFGSAVEVDEVRLIVFVRVARRQDRSRCPCWRCESY